MYIIRTCYHASSQVFCYNFHSRSLTVPSASIAMSTLSNWLQPDYYIEHINVLSRRMKIESVINTLRLNHVDNPHLIIYGALIVTAALYLAGRHIRKNASLSIRP